MTHIIQIIIIIILLTSHTVTVPSSYPVNALAAAPDSHSLHLYWSPPPLEEQNGNILYYGINITEESGKVLYYQTSDSETSYYIYGLHPYYHYQYQLTAFTGAGHGPYSPPNSIQLPQDGRYYAWSWTTIIFSFCCAHYHDSYTSSINMQFLVRILFNSMSPIRLLELSPYHGYLPSLSIGMGKSLAM